MPPYNNQMFPQGMPQAPPGGMGPGGQMGGIDMGMLQQYLAMMQGQQMRGGMESMNPDQGMNQAPPQMQTMEMRVPPGWRGGQFPGGSGPFMPPGMDPGQGGSYSYTPGKGYGSSGPPPGQGQLMQKPMVRPNPGMPPAAPPQIRPDAPPPGPPPMRMPPGAGEWRNPATNQMMNQTPRFSGQNNPYEKKADAPVPSTPQTGGVMTASPSDVSPIKVPMGGSSTAPQDAPMVNTRPLATARPKTTTGGSAPFNPNGGFSSPAKKTRAATKAEMVTKKFSK